MNDGRHEALVAAARALQAEGRFRESEQALREALRLKPGDDTAAFGLGCALLAQGRWAEGWPLMETRVRLAPDLVPAVGASYPEWRGEPLEGKRILVWLEQGLGDQIMFSRFALSLRARGAQVTLACDPALADLFASLADRVIPVGRGQGVPVPRHDYWTRYASLPLHLGVTPETLPNAPYLTAPADRRARWRDWSGVGLAWEASATGPSAARKSLPPATVEGLTARGLKSLRPQDTRARDFADTAAILERLDLVVSIDTAVAHLAGAMGKPVLILLPVGADWRWLEDRADSPWYPTARLIRQRQAGDWDPVIEEVLAALP